MALEYNITTLLQINDVNANINALTPESVNAEAYEMAFFGVANFLSGDYIQNSGAVNDIKSNILVNADALNNAHFFYVSNVDTAVADYPGTGLSNYGNGIRQTGTIFGSGAVKNVASSSNGTVLLSSLPTFGDEFIAMTNISAGGGETVVDSANEKLLAGQSSAGDALFQAVSAALFKKLGKNAALLNDTDLVTDLNTKFHTALNGSMGESNANYNDSKYFKRYLASGRYQPENDDINAVVAYNVNNTLINMVINISGHVNDNDGGPDLSSNGTAITQIFGTSGSDHKISVTAPSIGEYNIKVFVQLRHDERF